MPSVYDPHSLFSVLCPQPLLYMLASHLLMGSPLTLPFYSFLLYQSWNLAYPPTVSHQAQYTTELPSV